MQVIQTRVHGEDFIGLLGFATDTYAILSPNFRENEILGVPTLKSRIYGTNLVGIFCAGNSNGLILPYFISDDSMNNIKAFMKKLDVNVVRVSGDYTAIGNLVACNDHAAVVSPDIQDIKGIREALDVEVFVRKISGNSETGACVVATNKGFMAHPNAEHELGYLEKTFNVKGDVGTVNRGVGFVKSGLIANSNGYATGMLTTPIELGRIEDSLGLA
ncbi:MAG: translation initiation factor IF-6 [Candidatus Altiarchaeota archaeon]|nr:translation initiation factor IF-6 [Candidatus Altiarchaeota archaeon]